MITSSLYNWATFGNNVPIWLYKIIHNINRIECWFQYRLNPTHRYHVVATDLPPAYYDIDTIMEAALVKLLRRYVDEEVFHMQYGDDQKATGWEALQNRIANLKDIVDNPVEGREWESKDTKPSLNAEIEIAEIYQWFVIDKPLMLELLQKETRTFFNIRCKSPLIKYKNNDNDYVFSQAEKENMKGHRTKMNAIETEIESKTDDMLVRLVKIRGAMWT